MKIFMYLTAHNVEITVDRKNKGEHYRGIWIMFPKYKPLSYWLLLTAKRVNGRTIFTFQRKVGQEMGIKNFLKTLTGSRSPMNIEQLKTVYIITNGGYEKQIDALKDAAIIEQILDKGQVIQIESIIVKKEQR